MCVCVRGWVGECACCCDGGDGATATKPPCRYNKRQRVHGVPAGLSACASRLSAVRDVATTADTSDSGIPRMRANIRKCSRPVSVLIKPPNCGQKPQCRRTSAR